MAFSMEIPDANAVAQELMAAVTPEPAETDALQEQAKANALALMTANLDNIDERREIIGSIEQFGFNTIEQSSQKNALLQIPVGNLSKQGDEGSAVSKSLQDLHHEIKDLDPSAVDFAKDGLLGKIFNPIRSYFERYQKADVVIAGILESLDKGRTTLRNDNTTLELEQQSLRELTKRLNNEIALGMAMDEYIESHIAEAQAANANAEQIRFVQEEVLFPLRQRLQDMQQMTAVNQQGILAIEVIRRNNRELIRGVERAKTVTVAALKTAVIVAAALYNQKVVLKKIQILNETTNNIIAGTSKMLLEQGAQIQQQAMETGVSIDTLQQAYTDVITALDEIASFKQQALPQMKQTIAQFRTLADEGEKRIAKLVKASDN
ncbi:MAG: toxic anion resistance protein [Oscillospiraceae bacterium]|jgi:uncharacterized protein YaaN involved in tellurite resistance|nr:toxic anion resistance protein [Oscillospiraceae bacterium]